MAAAPENRLRVTEYLDLDLDREQWLCNRCGRELGSARDNYKKGCLLNDRDPREIHPPLVTGAYNFSQLHPFLTPVSGPPFLSTLRQRGPPALPCA